MGRYILGTFTILPVMQHLMLWYQLIFITIKRQQSMVYPQLKCITGNVAGTLC